MFSLDGQRLPFNNDLGMQNKKYKIFISFIHFKLRSQCLWLIHTRDSDGDSGLARRGGEIFQEWSISFVHQSSQLSQLQFLLDKKIIFQASSPACGVSVGGSRASSCPATSSSSPTTTGWPSPGPRSGPRAKVGLTDWQIFSDEILKIFQEFL